MVGVWRESLTVDVRLPNDSRHIAFKVHMGVQTRWGIGITACLTRLYVSASKSGVVGVGCITVVVADIGGMLMVVVMRDAEVRSA